jgi:hypothetical protein
MIETSILLINGDPTGNFGSTSEQGMSPTHYSSHDELGRTEVSLAKSISPFLNATTSVQALLVTTIGPIGACKYKK